MKEKSYLSVVVYLKNNLKHSQKFVAKLNHYLTKKFEHFEIILVNNGNKIDSQNITKSIENKLGGHASIINLPWKQDIEASILAGTSLSVGDFVVEIDSPENVHDLSIISRLFEKCTEGYDIVSATPDRNKDLFSRLFYFFLKNISNTKVNISTEPIRIMTRRALNSALKSKEKVRYRQVLYLLTGFPHATINYSPNGKYHSNKSLGEKLSLALEIMLSYTDFGLKLTFGLSLLFLLISMAVGLYVTYVYLNFKQVATGWTTTMLFLSFGFSGLFLITGILTKYLTMVLSETKDRPPYVIESIQKIK